MNSKPSPVPRPSLVEGQCLQALNQPQITLYQL
jgi:hypothetical protein